MKTKFAYSAAGLATIFLICFLFQTFIINPTKYSDIPIYSGKPAMNRQEDVITFFQVPLASKTAIYIEIPKQSSDLEKQLGMLYALSGETAIYQLKGSDNFYQLIRQENNNYTLLQFSYFTSTVNYQYILENVLCVSDAKGISKIKFYSNCSSEINGKTVQNPTIILNSTKEKARFYDILSNIQITECSTFYHSDMESFITTVPQDEEMPSQKSKSYSENYRQNREIDITFQNDITITLYYSSESAKIFTYGQKSKWASVSNSDNTWLMDMAQIP